MTRETKIGLLVGLGFIVVFAVLLSHTDPGSSDGALSPAHEAAMRMQEDPTFTAELPSIDKTQDISDAAAEDRGQDGEREHRPASPGPVRVSPPQQTDGLAYEHESDLPAIDNDPLPPAWYRESLEGAESQEVADRPTSGVEDTLAYHDVTSTVPPLTGESSEMHRVAPPSIEPPRPTPQHQPPARSQDPDEGLAMGNSGEDTSTIDDAPRVAPDNVVRDRSAMSTYVVQKGESLSEIATKVYGTIRSMDHLLAANKDLIKNKNNIYEGQVLQIPEWADAENFEPVGNPGVPEMTRGSSRTITMQNLLDEVGRVAPRPALSDDAPSAERAAPDVTVVRSYTIQPSDTFSSIARQKLGSETLWPEIQKANPDLDPRKLRPGITIKLPPAKAWNTVVSSE